MEKWFRGGPFDLWGGGGGLEELRKKFPAELSQRKKKSCNTDGQEKNAYTNCEAKKNFVPSQEMLYGKDVPQEI